MFNLFSIVNLLGISQACFFSVQLSLLSRRNKAHQKLIFFLLTYALVQLSDLLEEAGLFFRYPHLSQVFPPLVFTLGPQIYLYVRSVTESNFRLKAIHLLHFVPYLLLMLLLLPYYFSTASEKIVLLRQDDSQDKNSLFISFLGISQVIIYVVLGFQSVKKYHQKVRANFSSIDKLKLGWLRTILLALLIIWIIWVADTAYPSNTLFYTEALLFCLFIYFLGYKGLQENAIFMVEPNGEMAASVVQIYNQPQEKPDVKKYEKSSVNPEKVEDYLKALQDKMDKDRIYRNSSLSLADLAQSINIPSHHLSQIINENLGSNFYDFVNGYRIDEVKSELLNPSNSHLTILGIALNAGFNSKASFNKAFKKHTGTSPSNYKKGLIADH